MEHSPYLHPPPTYPSSHDIPSADNRDRNVWAFPPRGKWMHPPRTTEHEDFIDAQEENLKTFPVQTEKEAFLLPSSRSSIFEEGKTFLLLPPPSKRPICFLSLSFSIVVSPPKRKRSALGGGEMKGFENCSRFSHQREETVSGKGARGLAGGRRSAAATSTALCQKNLRRRVRRGFFSGRWSKTSLSRIFSITFSFRRRKDRMWLAGVKYLPLLSDRREGDLPPPARSFGGYLLYKLQFPKRSEFCSRFPGNLGETGNLPPSETLFGYPSACFVIHSLSFSKELRSTTAARSGSSFCESWWEGEKRMGERWQKEKGGGGILSILVRKEEGWGGRT